MGEERGRSVMTEPGRRARRASIFLTTGLPQTVIFPARRALVRQFCQTQPTPCSLVWTGSRIDFGVCVVGCGRRNQVCRNSILFLIWIKNLRQLMCPTSARAPLFFCPLVKSLINISFEINTDGCGSLIHTSLRVRAVTGRDRIQRGKLPQSETTAFSPCHGTAAHLILFVCGGCRQSRLRHFMPPLLIPHECDPSARPYLL